MFECVDMVVVAMLSVFACVVCVYVCVFKDYMCFSWNVSTLPPAA